ncbi:hypothetical protein C2E23DRAFT_811237, partial [Lenzites betulinus]
MKCFYSSGIWGTTELSGQLRSLQRALKASYMHRYIRIDKSAGVEVSLSLPALRLSKPESFNDIAREIGL